MITRSPRALLVLLAVLTLSIVLGACGSEDQPTAATTPDRPPVTDSPPPPVEAPVSYVNKLNAAQEKFVAKVKEVDIANPDSPEDFKESLDQVIPVIDTMADEVEGLQPPPEVAAQQDEFVSITREYVTVLKNNTGDLNSPDNKKVKASAENIAAASTTFSKKIDRIIADINTKLMVPVVPPTPESDPEASEKQPSSSIPETQPAA